MLFIYFLLLLHVFASVLNLHRWEYMHSPSENSKEAEILEVLRHPRDWVPWCRQSSLPGAWGTLSAPPVPLADTTPMWFLVSCVLELRSSFSTLASASSAGGEMCFKHRKLPPDAVGDGWWGGSLSADWCKNSFCTLESFYMTSLQTMMLYFWELIKGI